MNALTPVMLCADTESLHNAELIGLPGENLSAQNWLQLCSSGQEARNRVAQHRALTEVWVASCDDIEPINLAATLKGDRHSLRVSLVSLEGSGSLLSRAKAAGVEVCSGRIFASRYAQAKQRLAQRSQPVSVEKLRTPNTRQSAKRKSWTIESSIQGCDEGFCRNATESRQSIRSLSDSEDPFAPDEPMPIKHERQYQSSLSFAPEGSSTMPASALSTQPQASVRAGVPHQSAASNRIGLYEGASQDVRRMKAPGFLLPIVSGSGGAGKSTISAICAHLCHGMGYRTLLLDFDLQFGDLRELMGRPDALAIDEVLAEPRQLEKFGADGKAPWLLGAPRKLEDAEAVVNEAPRLIDVLLHRFDIVIANTGAAWEEQHAMLLERSSKALFLVDQRSSSLRACNHALDLCARCGIATGPFMFAANHCSKGSLFTSIDVSCALHGAHAVELREGGSEVEELASAGQITDLIAAGNELCLSLEKVLVDILPEYEGRPLPVQQTKRGKAGKGFNLVRRLMGKEN